jgi:sigma-E factor negative regulatory protein RseC
MTTLTHADDGLIEGQARVVAVEGSTAWLAAEPAAACGSCATRSACGAGSASTTPVSRWPAPRTLPDSDTPLVPGDRVRIGIDRSALTRAALAAYSLPLAAMLAAALAAQAAGDAAAVVAALAGLSVGVVVARRRLRHARESLAPVVLGRADDAAAGGCAPVPARVPVSPMPVRRHRSP